MSEIRDRKVSLKHADSPSRPAAEVASTEAGGLSASLALIRQGHVPLKHVEAAVGGAKKKPPMQRQPSGSIASALRRRLAERKMALDGALAGAATAEVDDDEWA